MTASVLPTARSLVPRLASGKRREAFYGFHVPSGHVNELDMHDKLKARANDAAGLRCYLCGKVIAGDNLHLDHVRPLVASGHHLLWNLEPSCSSCNLTKGDTLLPFEPPLDDFEPLFERLSREPIEDLWVADEKLAAKVIVDPRPVPTDPDLARLRQWDKIVEALLAADDPYEGLPLREIAKRSGLSEGDLGSNYWSRLMGIGREDRSRRPHDRRLRPHPVLVATRVERYRGRWGKRGFRLRFRVTPEAARSWLRGEGLPQGVGSPNDPRFPDHDEQPQSFADRYVGAELRDALDPPPE